MSETEKTYRIHTIVGTSNNGYASNLNIQLDQDYNTFEIMSLKISSTDTYKLHNSNHGIIVGRVLANGNFGIPNAKISLFVSSDSTDSLSIFNAYPYSSVGNKKDNVRYNLLPDNKVDDCHQVVGTFPNKTYVLDNNVYLEVFDKYYKFTTRTNNSGDYMLCGIPVGTYVLHMDLDISDCGILSQRPRDFVYKGYTIEQFENPNQFKTGNNIDSLSQIFSQNKSVTVNPFWGNDELGDSIGITRADIEVAFTFEPTAVFIGSVVSDNSSNGFSRKCVPTNQMGAMDELVTGEGRIEMIRKTPGGSVEEFQVKGTQLINANGVWCYQIPMNLDYMMTDEYGNMVPTDDPSKGIPTRTRVRFRISLQDSDENTDTYLRGKVLVPNNPQNTDETENSHEPYDYNFGTNTNENSFRDLFWNNVYTVKSYIPRISKSTRIKNERFTGIKHCNTHGNNNPIPYNNIRIRLPLMFTILCALIKTYIRIVGLINIVIYYYCYIIGHIPLIKRKRNKLKNLRYVLIADGLCPDLDNWYFAPKGRNNEIHVLGPNNNVRLLSQTFKFLENQSKKDDENIDMEFMDEKSIDYQNSDDSEAICLTSNIDYLMSCIEMALAQEYHVINFDFYNDWINGVLYIPRWARIVKRKRTFWLFGKKREKIKSCNESFTRGRKYVQQCSLTYNKTTVPGLNNVSIFSRVNKDSSQKYHKAHGKKMHRIFGKERGIVHTETTIANQEVYYLKPCEWNSKGIKTNLFATDLVLLGSLNNCDSNGIPDAFKFLTSSTYILPTNLALTNMDTEGYLYGNEKGTICSGKHNYESTGLSIVDSNSLEAEIKYYSGSSETLTFNEEGYSENEMGDTMPITEAAGISWDYTGPGQGKDNPKRLYFPGGHFLGLSCVNSQTNIKSCLNLERICEAGATMSQRKETVRKLSTDSEGNPVFHYTYNIPTGFIAEDEIVDSDLRSMFSTMNQNRLLATKINPKTGYRCYDFTYLAPNGFNGEFSEYTKGSNEYNEQVEVKDEDLTAYHIAPASSYSDYDAEETENTQRRTIESPIADYYLFRMGLSYKNIKGSAVSNLQRRAFLHMTDKGRADMPQYENSFYFYFGLVNGATAFDEFMKDFYSTCSSDSLLDTGISADIVTDWDYCSNTGKATIELINMQSPYTIEISNGVTKKTNSDRSSFYNLIAGNYTIKITDNNNVIITKDFSIGNNLASAEIIPENYKGIANGKGNDNGGYFTISNLNIGNNPIDSFETVNIILSGDTIETNKYQEDGKIYVPKPDTYNILVEWKTTAGCNSYRYSLGTYTIADASSLHVYMGDNDVIDVLNDINNWYLPNWWTGLTGTTIVKRNETIQWAAKHYIFAQSNRKMGEDTFDNVVITDANKALFGQVQNSNQWLSGTIYSTYDANNGDIPIGYDLTDTNQACQTISNNASLSAVPFGAMVYEDGNVGGMSCGQISNATGFSATPINTTANFNYIKGFGCLISDGNDVEMVKVTKDGVIIFNEEKLDPYNGNIYLLFRYPSIYRPFYANADFYTISNPLIEVEINENEFTEDIDYEAENSTTYLEVHNGITYKNSFSSNSTVNGLTHILTATSLTQNDMNGITETRANDRVINFIVRDNSGVTEYSYYLIEGTPKNYENYGVAVSDSIYATFYDNLWYRQGSTSGRYTFGTISEDDSDEEIKYYICSRDCLVSRNEAICTYTDDTNYVYTVGKYQKGDGKGTWAPIRISKSKKKAYLDYGKSFGIGNPDFTNAKTLYSTTVNSFNSNDITLQTYYDVNTIPSYNINQPITIGDGQEYAFNPDAQMIIGVYNGEQNELGKCRLFRLYPYILEGKNYDED